MASSKMPTTFTNLGWSPLLKYAIMRKTWFGFGFDFGFGLGHCPFCHFSFSFKAIDIETSEEELLIRIANPLGPAGTDAPSVRPGAPPDEHGPGAGFGLIGLRERVAALGGSVATARIGHGFRLEARLPLGEAARA